MKRLDLIEDWAKLGREARYRAEGLALVCSVSGSQLRRYFAPTYGLAPQGWLNELQNWDAMELLCEGQLVKEVAAKLCFGNESHLCHRFREYHGCTPGECVMIYRLRVERARQSGSSSEEIFLPWKAAERRLMTRVSRVHGAFRYRFEAGGASAEQNKLVHSPSHLASFSGP